MLELYALANLTRVTGMTVFAIAGVACFAAAAVALCVRHRRMAWTWLGLGALHAALVWEVPGHGRFWVAEQLRALMRTAGLTEARGGIQAVLSAMICIGLATISSWVAWRLRRKSLWAVAVCFGIAATLTMFALEVISWHETSDLLYRQVGPIMLIAWGWLTGATLVIAAAIAMTVKAGRGRGRESTSK